MILARVGWQDVRDFSRDAVVVIPTGSLEQHGPHLPLFTDSILVTAVAEAVERLIPDQVILTPTLWLGASSHHLAFDGSLSASVPAYVRSLTDVVRSMVKHGFRKFFVLNGHGGNTELNGITLRSIKEKSPSLMVGHQGYFQFIPESVMLAVMEGPWKNIRHACEAEASLMLHISPELVKLDKLRDDGLEPVPSVTGMIHHFDEMTEEGSLGFATLANAEKGKKLFDAAVEGATANLRQIAEGYVLQGFEPKS